MDLGFKDKTAVVVGGASNIGRAVSLRLAMEKANIVIADIDQEQAEKVVKTIEAAGDQATSMTVDVTDYGEVKGTIEKIIDKFVKIDALVYVVGWDSLMLFVDTKPDLWDKIIDLNYKGMMNCCHSVLPYMIERKAGAIVSIASDAGRMGEFREGVYAGAKAAIIALTKTLAREVGRYGIRLNAVCPGLTVQPGPEAVGEYGGFGRGYTEFPPEMVEKATKLYPLRRLGKPEDIADAVAFLASDCASFITGQTLSVSGGYTMM
jgi:NAD(P)-dependent dehydrogenase (short-subunit alcohol dehydrogenase family)